MAENGVCICGNPTQFRSPKKGFKKYCSKKCWDSDVGYRDNLRIKMTQLTPEIVFKKDNGISPASARVFYMKYMIRRDEYHCFSCRVSTWLGKLLSLNVDHINGDNRDNRLENLRLLCPNCHSQTETFGGGNAQRCKVRGNLIRQLSAYLEHFGGIDVRSHG
ncbi:MAG: HNH endonuclease [Acidiferrobacterales bacterium]